MKKKHKVNIKLEQRLVKFANIAMHSLNRFYGQYLLSMHLVCDILLLTCIITRCSRIPRNCNSLNPVVLVYRNNLKGKTKRTHLIIQLF